MLPINPGATYLDVCQTSFRYVTNPVASRAHAGGTRADIAVSWGTSVDSETVESTADDGEEYDPGHSDYGSEESQEARDDAEFGRRAGCAACTADRFGDRDNDPQPYGDGRRGWV